MGVAQGGGERRSHLTVGGPNEHKQCVEAWELLSGLQASLGCTKYQFGLCEVGVRTISWQVPAPTGYAV